MPGKKKAAVETIKDIAIQCFTSRGVGAAIYEPAIETMVGNEGFKAYDWAEVGNSLDPGERREFESRVVKMGLVYLSREYPGAEKYIERFKKKEEE